MRIRETYICEVCGGEYEYKESAAKCEASAPLGEPKFKVGDSVKFLTRYNGIETDRVIAVELGRKYECLYYDRAKGNVEVLNEHWDNQTHCWILTLEDEHQWSKDDWSNKISDDCILQT